MILSQAILAACLFWLGAMIWRILSWSGGILLEEGWRKGGRIFYLLFQIILKHFSFFSPLQRSKYLIAICRYLTPSRLLAGHLDRTRFLLAHLK